MTPKQIIKSRESIDMKFFIVMFCFWQELLQVRVIPKPAFGAVSLVADETDPVVAFAAAVITASFSNVSLKWNSLLGVSSISSTID